MKFEIFTDAASYNNGLKDPNKPQHTYSSALLIHDGEIIATFGSFNPNSTNNHGEISAIRLGLIESIKFLLEHGVDEFDIEIDLYSDSEICVKGLNIWMEDWKRNSVDDVWFNSRGPVSNQKIFKDIDELLVLPKGKKIFKNVKKLRKKYDINIYHTRGHMDFNKKSDYDKFCKTFLRNNGFLPSEKKLIFINHMNNIVDKHAGHNLKDNLRREGLK